MVVLNFVWHKGAGKIRTVSGAETSDWVAYSDKRWGGLPLSRLFFTHVTHGDLAENVLAAA